jgi:hypothetical protein
VNLEAFDGGLLARLQALAGLPYQLELQLDATKGGVGKTIGVDLTLAMHTMTRLREAFATGAMPREHARCSNRGASAMVAGSS